MFRQLLKFLVTHKKKIIIGTLLSIFLALVFTFLLIALILSALIDGNQKNPFIKQAIDPKVASSVHGKVQDLCVTLLKPKSGKSETIVLTAPEVNGMLNIGVPMANLQLNQGKFPNAPGAILADARFVDGKFDIFISKHLDFDTPFGSYVNIRLKLMPVIKDGNFDFQLYKASIGSISLPSFLNQPLSDYLSRKYFVGDLILLLVSKVDSKNGDLIIDYYPENIKKFLLDYFNVKI